MTGVVICGLDMTDDGLDRLDETYLHLVPTEQEAAAVAEKYGATYMEYRFDCYVNGHYEGSTYYPKEDADLDVGDDY